MADNKHTNPIISQIQLPGSEQVYDIHDLTAIHSIEDLELATVLQFKGKKETITELLAITDAKIGDVWLVKNVKTNESDIEFVWLGKDESGNLKGEDLNDDGNPDGWERLGNVHDAASSTHTHEVKINGAKNKSSDVSIPLDIPTVTPTSHVLGLEVTAGSTPNKENALGEYATFKTTVTNDSVYLKATASGGETASSADNFLTSVTVPEGGKKEFMGSKASFKVNPTHTKQKMKIVEKVSYLTDAKTTGEKVLNTNGSVSGGTLPTLTTEVSNGCLKIGFSQGAFQTITMPTFKDSTAITGTIGTSNFATGELVATSNTSNVGGELVTSISETAVSVTNTDAAQAITDIDTAGQAVTITHASPTIKLETVSASGNNIATIAVKSSASTETDDKDVRTVLKDNPNPNVKLLVDGNTADQVTYTVTTVESNPQTYKGTADAQEWSYTSANTEAPTAKS